MKPRSKTNLSDRVRSFISEARLGAKHPNSSTEVLHTIMGPKFQKAVSADRDVAKWIMGRGWEAAIRAYLKGVPNGDEELSEAQAEFWPETVRAIVLDIKRARVYVPSRMEHVPLMPATITRSEIKEAGEYLIKKGEDTIRIGNRLINLYEVWDA